MNEPKPMPIHKQEGMYEIKQGWYSVIVWPAPNKRKPHVDLTKLAEALPHGSGIDGNWHVHITNHGDLRVASSFHHMNDNGMYDGWNDFSFRIHKHTTTKYHPLKGPSAGLYQVLHKKGDIGFTRVICDTGRVAKEHLEEYLNDTILHSLEKLIPPAKFNTITATQVHRELGGE